jgi:hypothetical protein
MRKIFLIIMLLGVTQAALADLPLIVKDLITDQDKYKVNFSLRYSNTENRDLSSTSNRDVVITTLGIYYGFRPKLETYVKASYKNSNLRNSSSIYNKSSADFKDAWLGFSYQFSKDNDTPGMFGFIQGAILEKRDNRTSSAKSWILGFMTYRALDPIVLKLSTTYMIRKKDELNHKLGNYLSFSPSVSFAVNDFITLTTGFSWVNYSANRINNIAQSIRTTSTNLDLGLSYVQSQDMIVNITLNTNISGQSRANLGINWTRKY